MLTGVLGSIIGIPALRLSGLYLALITLMAAGAITLLLKVYKFPNGGSGFWGFDTTKPSGSAALPRPSIALGDIAYFRYSLVVVSLMFLLVTWHIKGKPGRAWASIRQSQVTAVSAGVHTTLYKLWAFALSAFITGVAGALLAASPGGVTVNQFPVEGSIILLAVVLMGGVYSVWGAVVAAFLLRILPRLLEQQIGLSSEVLTMLFGLGVIQVLLTTPGGIVSDLARLGDAVKRRFSRRGHDGGGAVVIEISDLTVRFGGVTPIDDVTLTFGAGTNGLIGPNGAGKTTFFNVLSGFVRPQEGTVTAFGVDVLAMPAFRRARWGVRRTFQTEQAVADLSVYENVLLIEEQSSRRSSTLRADVIDAVEFVGLGPKIRHAVGTLGAAERRLVEVARAVVGKPRLVLLDEPARGLPDEETAVLGNIIRQIPERTGAMVVLVDHDMELVSATCGQVAVLDFGRVIANGPTSEVLADPLVIRAYLGDDESVQQV